MANIITDDKPVTSEDTYDLLKLDDEAALEEKEKKPDEKEEIEDKEEKEIEVDEEKEKETIESDEELITPPHRNEILKAYPDIFKKFPYLEQAMYREKAFSELFGTMDSAKEILEKSQDYDKFSDDLFKGDSTPIFKSVKEADEKAYSGLINNLMPTLSRIDTSAYHWLIGDVIRRTIISAVNSAKQKGNESEEGQALLGAAAKIHEFVFGDTNLQAPVKFGKSSATANPEIDEEKSKLSEERAQFIQEKFETTKNDLSGRVDNILKNTIDANIDPKDLMSKYIKKNAVNDAMRMLDDLIHEDARFVQLVDKLWQKAFENNFSQDSLGKIRSAFLSKSKTLLPEVIKKVRSEALVSQGSGRKQNEDKPRNKDVSDRVAEQPKNRSNNTDKKDGRGMRTVDFFNQD